MCFLPAPFSHGLGSDPGSRFYAKQESHRPIEGVIFANPTQLPFLDLDAIVPQEAVISSIGKSRRHLERQHV